MNAVSSSKHYSPVDQGTTAGVDPDILPLYVVVSQNGDSPRIFSKVSFVVVSSSDSEAHTVWITVAAAPGSVGSLDTGVSLLTWVRTWFGVSVWVGIWIGVRGRVWTW